MKKKSNLTQPLSKKEMLWLKNYLAEVSQLNDSCIILEEVDGLFCALIINPVTAKPSEWMPMVFGKNHKFKSDIEMENIFNLLVRYWNLAAYLIEQPITSEYNYSPLIIKDEENNIRFDAVKNWARGFQKGINYCENDWKILANEPDHQSLLEPFILLGQENLTDTQRADALTIIPQNVHKLFHFWLKKDAEKQEIAKNKAKVGRNDPCPCGSGKKYKKCCEGKEVVVN